MKDLWALVLATALVFGIYFGIRFLILWKAKKIVGKSFSNISEGVSYFYSPKCGACKRMEPIIEKLSKEVNILKIDVSTAEGERLAKEFGVLGTPTIVVVRNGKVEKVIVGVQTYEKLKKEIAT